MKIYDITPEVGPHLSVFPGDTPFSSRSVLKISQGDPIDLSSFTMSPHVGAHADSESHYHSQGRSIEARPLEPYLGPAQVMDLTHLNICSRITLAHLGALNVRAPRVLFKTGSQKDFSKWQEDFASLSPEVIYALQAQGVTLVGLDTPSVDPASSKQLESHQALYKTKMCVLENLDLSQVAAGVYTLIALPLKLKGLDASPVRAVLLDKFFES